MTWTFVGQTTTMLVLAVPFSLFALGALLFLTVRLDVMQTHLAVRQAARATRTALPAPPDPAVEVLPTD